VRGSLVEHRPAESPPPPAELALHASLTRRYFESRTAISEQNLHLLRRSRTEETLHAKSILHRSTSELAVEHAALIKRRFQREESTLAWAVRQVRQNVLKPAPAQPPAAHHSTPPPDRALTTSAALKQCKLAVTDRDQQIDHKLVAHRERIQGI
jgi:hypothetical protein